MQYFGPRFLSVVALVFAVPAATLLGGPGFQARPLTLAVRTAATEAVPPGGLVGWADLPPGVGGWADPNPVKRTVLRGHDGLMAVAYSPDGRTLASAGDDLRILLRRGPTWETAAVLRGHT